jgi:hypothetical protein
MTKNGEPPKAGELYAFAAGLLGMDAETVAHVVIVVTADDGCVGMSGTPPTEAETLAVLAAALLRLATGMHDDEQSPIRGESAPA